MIRRILAVSTLAVAATAVAIVPVTPAGAATNYSISGTLNEVGPDNFVAVNPTPDFVYVGVDVHPIVFHGSLEGTATSTEHTTEHPNAVFETHNIESFDNVTVTAPDGTFIGTGSLVIDFSAVGYFTIDSAGNIGGAFNGTWQVVSAGGGLAGLHGSGSASGVPGSTTGYGTYTGSLHR